MQKWTAQFVSGAHDAQLLEIYPAEQLERQRARYAAAATAFSARFLNDGGALFVSAPGRVEIGGNHTDHNHGHVLAGAVDMDMIACAAPTGGSEAVLYSEGFGEIRVDTASLAPLEAEKETSAALLRGIAAYMQSHDYKIGGFSAYMTSDILKGSGLSSSAAFEMLVCCIFNHLYNGGRMSASEMAMCGQYAENVYFQKPCGLMDQMASAVGGFVAIDFEKSDAPLVRPLSIRWADTGYALCTVDVKSDHEDLTADYAAIPAEMRAVAAAFGEETLRTVDPNVFYAEIARVRTACGDRAVLRAMHFFEEDKRATLQAEALSRGDIDTFLALVRESGRSSAMYLQNTYVPGAVEAQAIMVALGCSERLLFGRGASRVHGGGFAGTIQAFVPVEMLQDYQRGMEAVFGPNSCHALSIRPAGAVRVL